MGKRSIQNTHNIFFLYSVWQNSTIMEYFGAVEIPWPSNFVLQV